LSISNESSDIAIYLLDSLGDEAQAQVQFAGLAPGIVGLYQVNFTIPSSGLANGDVDIAFNTDEGVSDMATIALSGFSQSAVKTDNHRRIPKLRVATHTKTRKDRRALPPRTTRTETEPRR
jgi:hypothetical protein